MSRRRRGCLPWVLILLLLGVLGFLAVSNYAPALAQEMFGAPSPALNGWQRLSFGLRLVLYTGNLTGALDPLAPEQVFIIAPGENAASICVRMQSDNLIRDAETLRAYLVWSGRDTSLQAGTYRLSASLNGLQIAEAIQNPTPADANLVLLPGRRMEEVAEALGTSGLEINPTDFLTAAASPLIRPAYLPAGASAEGFLFPDAYTLARDTTASQLLQALFSNFDRNLTQEMQERFSLNGLNVFQAVTLASIIEREALFDEEMPVIASVFYNRIADGWKLESDPTIQYALGYNPLQGTWWTNPLSYADLQVDSSYNSYLNTGLPPSPICSPSLAALQAVAFPAQTPYYFFMARCDGSGYHNFSKTFEQHQMNLCP